TNTGRIFNRGDRLTTGSLTLAGGENFPKVFLLEIDIARDNKTYSMSRGPPEVTGTEQNQSFRLTTSCEGKTASTFDTNEYEARFYLPGFGLEQLAMGSDSTVL